MNYELGPSWNRLLMSSCTFHCLLSVRISCVFVLFTALKALRTLQNHDGPFLSCQHKVSICIYWRTSFSNAAALRDHVGNSDFTSQEHLSSLIRLLKVWSAYRRRLSADALFRNEIRLSFVWRWNLCCLPFSMTTFNMIFLRVLSLL